MLTFRHRQVFISIGVCQVSKERIIGSGSIRIVGVMDRFVVGIRSHQWTAVQISAQHEILFQDPFHHGHCFWLSSEEEICRASIAPLLQCGVLRRKVSIEINILSVGSAAHRKSITRSLGRIFEAILFINRSIISYFHSIFTYWIHARHDINIGARQKTLDPCIRFGIQQ